MIIILGPDCSGKTTLAKRLTETGGSKYFHYTKDSAYDSYLKDLCPLNWWNSVLDRHMMCEFPYSIAMNRKFQFTMKQWHNILLSTLIQKPVIVLAKHKPLPFEYPAGQYLPYDKWDECLHLYEALLSSHKIPYIPYDYTHGDSDKVSLLLELSADYSEDMKWWPPLWTGGVGCIGSPAPKVLLVAERMGPSNFHNIPFETGPTGQMLTDLLAKTGTPLNLITVTNFVKSFRGDSRGPNGRDLECLELELDKLHPQHVVFMGSIARRGVKVAKARGIPYTLMPHFGAYSHRGISSIKDYMPEWTRLLGITQAREL